MFNFKYQNPTKIIFGKGCIESIRKEIPSGSRVLITYGGGSIKRNGVFDEVKAALEGTLFAEAQEISLNPKLATYSIKVTNEEGDLFATFEGMVYRKKQPITG